MIKKIQINCYKYHIIYFDIRHTADATTTIGVVVIVKSVFVDIVVLLLIVVIAKLFVTVVVLCYYILTPVGMVVVAKFSSLIYY